MKRIALTVAAAFALVAPATALANVYIVYTSGFDVVGTTGCDYGGTSGTLVTMANGSEGCMVEAGMAADDGDEAAAALLDDYIAAGGEYDDGDDDPVYTEETFQRSR